MDKSDSCSVAAVAVNANLQLLRNQILVSLLAVYLLLSFFLLTATGFHAYCSCQRSVFYRVYLGCALSWALWHLYAFGLLTSDQAGTVFGWNLIGVLRFAAPALSLHLLMLASVRSSETTVNRIIPLAYLSAGVVIILQIVATISWFEPVRDHTGWLLDRENRVVALLTAVWIAVIGTGAVIVAVRRLFAADNASRSYAGICMAAVLFAAASGGVAGVFDTVSGRIPGMSVAAASIAAAGCVLVAWRRRFSPETVVTIAEDVLTAIPDAVLITAIDGSIQRLNPRAEEMIGYRSGEASHMHIDDLFEPGFGAALYERAERSDRNMWTQESRIRTREGKELPVVVNCSLIRKTSRNMPVAMVLSCHDRSFETMALDEFRKTEQLEALGFLAGGIAHDFNNLLTSIVAYLSLARTTEDLSDSMKEKLDKVDSAARLVIDLNRQLAAISKGSRPNKEHCSLRELLGSAIQLSLSGSSIECHSDIPDNLHAVEGDTTQLNQVFLNLLVNARQAMANGGVIGVRCSNIVIDDVPWVEVEITDQGSGIPPEKIDEVFKPFFTTKKQGTGLGLSVVKSVVEKHGGTVDVVSRAGVGTTFTIRLPSFGAVTEMAEQERTVPEETVSAAPGKILVMDDEDGVKKALSIILREKGHTVHAVDHGAAAITTYLKHRSAGEPFDLLLLDVTVRNGYGAREVIRRLKEINPDVVAVVMSGYGENALMKEYRKFGFCDVIEKPFDTGRVYHVVNQALTRLRASSS